MIELTVDTVFNDAERFKIDLAQIIQDTATDSAGGDQARRDDLIVQAVFAELRAPRTAETIRRRLVTLWPIIAPLAHRDPAQFDAIILEFADQITAR